MRGKEGFIVNVTWNTQKAMLLDLSSQGDANSAKCVDNCVERILNSVYMRLTRVTVMKYVYLLYL